MALLIPVPNMKNPVTVNDETVKKTKKLLSKDTMHVSHF